MHKHMHKYNEHKEEMLRKITILIFVTGHVVIAVILNYYSFFHGSVSISFASISSMTNMFLYWGRVCGEPFLITLL